MAKQECAELLYDGSGGLKGLVRAADGATPMDSARINAVVLHSRKDPAKEVAEWAPDGGRPDVSRRRGKAVLTLNGRGADPIRIAVVRSDRDPNVYYALSDCPSADFKERFVSLLDDHIPTITRMRLSNAEIRSIVGATAEGRDVRVRLVSSRSRRRGRGGFDSRVDRIDKSAKRFAASAGRGGREIMAVELACRPRGQDGGSSGMLTVSRDGRFSARRGAGVLFGAMLPRAADLAAGRAEVLLACAKTANRKIADQLIVRFKERVFADRGKNRAHIDAIGAMPYTVLVDHHADPSIHMSLVDYGDCSAYGIWVVANDEIAIIPSLFASGASMSRLVNHVMEKFGDATVEKYDGGP